MNDAELLARELATEQAHVDAVYARLDAATQSARTVARSGREIYTSDRQTWMREEDGTALFERDAFAFQAARRLATLDAEHEGLVFGRLDLDGSDPDAPANGHDRETRYIGRIGVRDEEYEPLVIDWRARAAEPFYRATPTNPMDVVRRRVLRCRNDQVIGIEDDLLDTDANRDHDAGTNGDCHAHADRDAHSNQDGHFAPDRDGYRDQGCHRNAGCNAYCRGSSGDAGADWDCWRGEHGGGDAWRTGWGDGRSGAYRAA